MGFFCGIFTRFFFFLVLCRCRLDGRVRRRRWSGKIMSGEYGGGGGVVVILRLALNGRSW